MIRYEKTDLEEIEDPLLSTVQVARLFGVDSKTINRWHRRGKFEDYNVTVFHTPGGHKRFRTSEINALVTQIYADASAEAEEARNRKHEVEEVVA